MSSFSPRLEVVIPTYNRAAELKLRLEELSPQLQEGEQITIFDNGSTDTTQDVCGIHAADPRVKVHRWSHNRGLSRNVMRCFEEARGEFVWVLSDDDPVRPDALPLLREILSTCSGKLLLFKAQGNSVRQNALFTSSASFLGRQSIMDLSYISSLVFHRETLDPHLGLLAPGAYSILPHVLVYVSAISEATPLETFTQQLLIDKLGETRVSRMEFLLGATTLPSFFADPILRKRVAQQIRSATRWMLFSALAQTSTARDRQEWRRVLRMADHALACCGATFWAAIAPSSLHSGKDKLRELLKMLILRLPDPVLGLAARRVSQRTNQTPDRVTCDARIGGA
ncbi:MAG: glycosyltransferase family 2 protein [Verrucomicrobiia bacterium]